MVPSDDPNTPSTPTTTQPSATPSPYTPTNELVVTQTPLIRRQDFTVGPKRRKVRVRWAAANKLGFIDVESKGIEMLQGKNLTVRRYRKKNRAERMRNFKKSIYEDLEGNAGSSAMVNEAFSRLNA